MIFGSVVDAHHRNAALHQLNSSLVNKIVHAHDQHSVNVSVHTVLIGCHFPFADIAAYKGDIVACGLDLFFEAVEDRCEIVLGETAVGLLREEDSDVICTVGFESTCLRIREISHLFCCFLDGQLCGFTHILVIVERLADCCNGNSAGSCNIFD